MSKKTALSCAPPRARAGRAPAGRSGAQRRRDRDHQRNGEPQRVRARDHQHGDERSIDEGGRSLRRGPGRRASATAATMRHDREPERRPVGERLRPRARRLRLRDQPHDAGERGLLPGAGDLDAQRAGAVHRPGDHRSSRVLRDGPRLARDHRLVDVAVPSRTTAVGRDARARAHEDEVADPQLARRHLLRPLADEPQPRCPAAAGQLASAPCAWEIERISIQWPSSMIVTSVASSHQRAIPGSPASPPG